MPQQNVDLDQFLVGRFISQHMVDGRYDGTQIPGVNWQGAITDKTAAANALKQTPWGQQQLSQIQAGIGFESPTRINGNTLSFNRTDNNDLIPAVSALLPGVPIATGQSWMQMLGNMLPSGFPGLPAGLPESFGSEVASAPRPIWMEPTASGLSDTGFGAGRGGGMSILDSLYPGGYSGDIGAPGLSLPNFSLPDSFGETMNETLARNLAAQGGVNYGFSGDVGMPYTPLGIDVPSYFGEDYSNVEAMLKMGVPLAQAVNAVNGASGNGGGLFNADGSLNLGKLLGGLGGAALGSLNGSKPAGTTTTVQDIPDWLKPYATSLLDQGQGLVNANKVTPDTFTQSDDVLKGIMDGSSIQAPQFNPYGGMTTTPTSNEYIGKTVAPTSNEYIGRTVTPGTNIHLGDNNPYFEGILTKALNDTQGRINNQFGNRSAFGSSGNQELLQRGLGDQANALRYGEYDKQTQLSEADIARRLQAEQADLARNSTLMQNQGQFNANLALSDLARNAQLTQNQGQFNANLYQNDATRNANIWGADANRNQQAFQYGKTQAYNAATGAPAYNAAKTNAAFSPLSAQKNLFTSGSQTSSPYFTNPAGGALYGGLLGSQLFGGK